MKDLNSFGVEASALFFTEFSSAEELKTIFDRYDPARLPWYVISGGNNILLRGDYRGLVIHPVNKNIEILAAGDGSTDVRVGGGVEWDDLVEWSVTRGLGGIENLSMIPGYAGAAPVQNIGAYGVEVKDVIVSVEVYDIATGEVRDIYAAECRFGYRDSIFKHELRGKVIILSVTLRLSNKPELNLCYGDLAAGVEARGGVSLRSVRDTVIAIREAKLPDPKVLGNAGSFFKNPIVSAGVAALLAAENPGMHSYPCDGGDVKLAAGWLIDRAGWKGRRRGNVGMHEKQALVLVNYGGATGGEIIALANTVQADVRALFGIELEMEVNIL